MKKAAVVGFLLALASGSLCISFRLEPEIRKCVKEEVHKDVLVVGEYRLSDMEGQRTDIVVGPTPAAGRMTAPALRKPGGFQIMPTSISGG